ncbi:MAG: hypothetical protein MUP58_00060 [Candidatus Nanohaloarchaeota archaeon QJJ-9]|nr:hypothetical protein [Candidatus Nanohaloarchaeota archaeon QJJ-9]
MNTPALQAAFQPVLEGAQQYIPNIVYALIVLVIGYIIGRIVFSVAKKFFKHTKVDDYFEEEGHLELKLSDLFPVVFKWAVYLVTLQVSAEFLGVQAVIDILQKIIGWIPGVIGAIAVFLTGYGIAIYTKDRIIGSETLYSDILGKLVFFFVIYISVSTAMPLVGIGSDLLNNILLILVGAVSFAFAIAAGLGLRDVFEEQARKYVEESQ